MAVYVIIAAGGYRDMAANMDWILQQQPSASEAQTMTPLSPSVLYVKLPGSFVKRWNPVYARAIRRRSRLRNLSWEPFWCKSGGVQREKSFAARAIALAVGGTLIEYAPSPLHAGFSLLAIVLLVILAHA
jgi:hypothetical protein